MQTLSSNTKAILLLTAPLIAGHGSSIVPASTSMTKNACKTSFVDEGILEKRGKPVCYAIKEHGFFENGDFIPEMSPGK